jgi:hypothetical protein
MHTLQRMHVGVRALLHRPRCSAEAAGSGGRHACMQHACRACIRLQPAPQRTRMQNACSESVRRQPALKPLPLPVLWPECPPALPMRTQPVQPSQLPVQSWPYPALTWQCRPLAPHSPRLCMHALPAQCRRPAALLSINLMLQTPRMRPCTSTHLSMLGLEPRWGRRVMIFTAEEPGEGCAGLCAPCCAALCAAFRAGFSASLCAALCAALCAVFSAPLCRGKVALACVHHAVRPFCAVFSASLCAALCATLGAVPQRLTRCICAAAQKHDWRPPGHSGASSRRCDASPLASSPRPAAARPVPLAAGTFPDPAGAAAPVAARPHTTQSRGLQTCLRAAPIGLVIHIHAFA